MEEGEWDSDRENDEGDGEELRVLENRVRFIFSPREGAKDGPSGEAERSHEAEDCRK